MKSPQARVGIGVEFDFYVVSHAATPRWELGPGLRGPMAPRPRTATFYFHELNAPVINARNQ
jgi:hypothetical protein